MPREIVKYSVSELKDHIVQKNKELQEKAAAGTFKKGEKGSAGKALSIWYNQLISRGKYNTRAEAEADSVNWISKLEGGSSAEVLADILPKAVERATPFILPSNGDNLAVPMYDQSETITNAYMIPGTYVSNAQIVMDNINTYGDTFDPYDPNSNAMSYIQTNAEVIESSLQPQDKDVYNYTIEPFVDVRHPETSVAVNKDENIKVMFVHVHSLNEITYRCLNDLRRLMDPHWFRVNIGICCIYNESHPESQENPDQIETKVDTTPIMLTRDSEGELAPLLIKDDASFDNAVRFMEEQMDNLGEVHFTGTDGGYLRSLVGVWGVILIGMRYPNTIYGGPIDTLSFVQQIWRDSPSIVKVSGDHFDCFWNCNEADNCDTAKERMEHHIKIAREKRKEWCNKRSIDEKDWHGVDLPKDLHALSMFIDKSIRIWEPIQDTNGNDTMSLKSIFHEENNGKHTMHLLRSYNEDRDMYHLSLIVNLHAFGFTDFMCERCGRIFMNASTLSKHYEKSDLKSCTEVVTEFKEKPFQVRRSPLEDVLFRHPILRKLMNGKTDPKYLYPYIITFDMETMPVDIVKDQNQDPDQSKKTHILKKHKAVSYSTVVNCSNIPEEYMLPKIMIRDSKGNPTKFRRNIDKDGKTTQSNFNKDAFELVKDMIEQWYLWRTYIVEQSYKIYQVFIDGCLVTGDKKAADALIEWVEDVSVIGFNSGKYDINVIKPHLYMNMINYEVKHGVKCLKKDRNSFMVLKSGGLRIIDMHMFTNADTSLGKFIEEQTGVNTKEAFPYEYMSNYDMLSEKQLPPIEAFYSRLRHSIYREEDLRMTITQLRNYGLNVAVRRCLDIC